MELERVAPQLRVTVVPDGKDWRSHLDQTHQHQETIEKALPDSKAQLAKVSYIGSREPITEEGGSRETIIEEGGSRVQGG